MDDAYNHPAAWPVERLLAECQTTRSRRSGPGGQHRNKVETAVGILHRATGLAGNASERRSQAENRQRAIFRLRVKLAIEHRCDVAAGQAPSGLWRSRCRNGQIRVNPRHEDYPAVLAEVLDRIAADGYEHQSAAEVLECSGSHLVKLIKAEPAALVWVNQQRAARGLHALR